MKTVQKFWLLLLLSGIVSCGEDEEEPLFIDESSHYTVTTFVGEGNNGDDPDTGGPALLWSPVNTVIDSEGNLFIADGMNNKIKKVSPAGQMVTVAGSYAGYADGTGTNALFDRPSMLAIDGYDNIIVGEAGMRLRKLAADAAVTTLAGDGTPGLVDGNGTAAKIELPGGIAVSPDGTIYFTQDNFNGVRKVSSSGDVSTFVGGITAGNSDGTGTAAKFNAPYGLRLDGSGNLYVADSNNKSIRKVTPSGDVTTLFKSKLDKGLGSFTMANDGTLFIVFSNSEETEVFMLRDGKTLIKIAGGVLGFADGPGNSARFSYASGLTIDDDGILYFSDFMNDAIRKIQRIN
jgi:sugar lactone lactonase YvrE